MVTAWKLMSDEV